MPLEQRHLDLWISKFGRYLFSKLRDPEDRDAVLADGLQRRNLDWPQDREPRADAVYALIMPPRATHVVTDLRKLDPGRLIVDEDLPRAHPALFGPKYVASLEWPDCPPDPWDRPAQEGVRYLSGGVWADKVDDDRSINVLTSLCMGRVAHRGPIPPAALPDLTGVTDHNNIRVNFVSRARRCSSQEQILALLEEFKGAPAAVVP